MMGGSREQNALDVIQEQVEAKAKELASLKRAANALATALGLVGPYAEIEDGAAGVFRIHPDQFANCNAPSAAARAYLEMRGHASSVDDIYESVKRGGFDVDGAGGIGGLRIALGKDREIVRLHHGAYGLRQWYPEMKEPRKSRKRASSNGDAAAPDADGAESEETIGAETEA